MSDRVVKPDDVAPGSTAEAALSALQAAKEASKSDDVAKGEGLTSLNRLLQWSAANSDGPEAAAATAERLKSRTPEQFKEDRAWLDAAFPDMFSDVKQLTSILTGKPVSKDGPVPPSPDTLSDDVIIECLNGIEEYMADMNYAINIEKLGTLAPVVKFATHPTPGVRVAALWVLGTAMQGVAEVKKQVLSGGGLPPVISGLADAQHAVRSKACMAASALLKHSDPSVCKAFVDAGGLSPLLRTTGDDVASVRRRSQFLLQHAESSGLSWLVDALLSDATAVKRLVASLANADASDSGEVEAAIGAIAGAADHDRIRLLEHAPTLPGVITKVRGAVTSSETKAELDQLLSKLTTTLPAL